MLGAPQLEEGSEGDVELEALAPFGLAGAAVLSVVVRVVEEVPPLADWVLCLSTSWMSGCKCPWPRGSSPSGESRPEAACP